MEETQALHREIAPDTKAGRWRRHSPAVLQRLLPRSRNAALRLDEARDQLNRALRSAETEEDDQTQ